MNTTPLNEKNLWRKLQAAQQPSWADHPELEQVTSEISNLPPLVFAGEIQDLRSKLAIAEEGKAFVVQGGDCSESFRECNAITIRETLKVILQMSAILSFAGRKPVVKVGRIAGQFAKPRSSDTETIDGISLPSYRGDMVNREQFNEESRQPNPQNMLEGYFRSSATLNLLRAFTKGGFASLKNVHVWNKQFVMDSEQGKQYEAIAERIDESIAFMETIGLNPMRDSKLSEVDFYTSHEALLLDYEEAMVRQDSLSGKLFDCSAHMLWIGDRTRQVDGAHVEFFRHLGNPVGIKVGPKHEIADIVDIINKINPFNEKGKIVLICRFGSENVRKFLPMLVKIITERKLNVLWMCDPMHGNTFSAGKYKTRDFDKIFSEIKEFFSVHEELGTVAGGIHIELTGLNVTECVGGAQKITEESLDKNYASNCDPRLNARQSTELAFRLAEMIRNSRYSTKNP